VNYLRSLAAFVVPAMAGIAILLTGPLWHRNRARNLATRVIGRWGTALAGIEPVISDPADAARHRPAVVVFNHQSGVDPVLLCALLRGNVVGVSKDSLRRHPVLGPLMMLADTVFVDRSAGVGPEALAPARRALERGLAVAIAPEGHRQQQLGSFRDGAVQLARQANVKLVPVIIHDSAGILPPGGTVMRPGRVHISVLDPLDPLQTSTRELEQLYHAHLAGHPAGTELGTFGGRAGPGST
jgi:putative phosphoserine phosphatase/1-acylglycerol-3-phosphate O-acyltransferase